MWCMQEAMWQPQNPLQGPFILLVCPRCLSLLVSCVPCLRPFCLQRVRYHLHRVDLWWSVGALVNRQVIDHVPSPVRYVVRIRPSRPGRLRKLSLSWVRLVSTTLPVPCPPFLSVLAPGCLCPSFPVLCPPLVLLLRLSPCVSLLLSWSVSPQF